MFPIFAGNSASTGYNFARSLRFRASASAYLSRTPSTTGTGGSRTWTYSLWVKRGVLGVRQVILDGYAASAGHELEFGSNDILEFASWGGAAVLDLATTQVFRDPSASYHIVLAVDTTQATASNRMKLYVNGLQVTSFTTATYPIQNSLTYIGSNVQQNIGRRGDNQFYFDGYTTEVNFVDGQQLTPSSFGSTNALTGVWQPARYTGSYGTNGTYPNFSDNSALTTSSNVGLGKDFSGNGNYWTTNNISITAGVTYDSMTDVPTLTSATAANYCVMNPLDKGSSATLSEANLGFNVSGLASARATIAIPASGKFYWENVIGSGGSAAIGTGVATKDASLSTYVGGDVYGWGYFSTDGKVYNNNAGIATYSTSAAGDVIGMAFDASAGTLQFFKNNTSLGTITGLTSYGNYFPALGNTNGAAFVNFGQRPFSYTPPTGYVALNTYNLPTSTIVKGNTVMDATLYTGNGSTQTVTNAAAFKPDLVWVKGRSTATQDHTLVDSVRGVSRRLRSNATTAEVLESGFNITAFNSSGFTAVDDTNGSYNVNGSVGGTFSGAALYVGWQWQAGQGSTSSNTNGTITSTVSVNASAGFSVVTYTGTGANATVGHGLGVAPSLVIAKGRGTQVATSDWATYHASLGNTQRIWLNLTNSAGTNSTYWNNTSPTSTTFSLGSEGTVNGLLATYVAYCWTPIAGYSAFGSVTGNGSADGPMIYTGFKPRFILYKRTDSTSDWRIWDTARTPYNAMSSVLYPDVSDAEFTATSQDFDALSNGFKIRNSSAAMNASGGTYIYAAFASNPFKNSLAQ